MDQVKKRIQELQTELTELQGKLEGDCQVENKKRDILSITDKRLLKAFPDLIFVIDNNETFLDFYTNQKEALIVSPDQIIQKRMEDILPEFLVKLTREKMKRIFETGNEQTYNYSIRNEKGEKLFYESRMVKYDDNSVLAIVKNVTDTFHLNRHAEQQRDYLIKMLNASPVGIIQLDANGNLLFLNEEIKDIFSLKKINLGKPCPFAAKLLKGRYDNFSSFLDALNKSNNYRLNFESVEMRFNGINYVFFIRAILTRNPITNEHEVLLYIQNITAFVRNQNELKDNLQKLAMTQAIGKISYWEFDIDADILRGFGGFLKYLPEIDIKPRLSSREFLTYIHPDDIKRVSFLFINQTGRKQDIKERFRLIIKNQIFWVEVNSTRSENPIPGKHPIIKGSVQDVTWQKTQEEKLLRNQQLLNVLLENIPVAVFARDAKTRKYTIWNRAAEQLFMLKKEDVIGKTVEEVHPENLAKMQRVRDDQCLSSGITLEFIDEKIVINNSNKYIDLVQMPLSIQGGFEAIVGLAIDNTNKKMIEEELLNAKVTAEKSDDLKSSFLANMSHEIRNPMNSIVGFSKILVEDEKLSSDEKKEFTELINSNASQLLRLLSDIIDIAKIENNELKIFKQDISLNVQMKRLKSMFEQSLLHAGKENIKVSIALGEDDNNCMINTDEQRFQQIMNNLLSNALRFTDKGEISFGYSLTKDGYFEFFVKDTGVGIPEIDQTNIFKKFQQSDNYKRQQGGKGLGLSISQELVKYLGGEIWVESVVGEGSTFYFTLPSLTKEEDKQLNIKETAPSIEITQYNWNGKAILIVDDRPDIISFVRILLKKTGITIHTANNGKQAVELVKELDGKLDVVLMDIQMPIMNGVDAMKIIKSNNPSLYVIAQTAFALEGDEKRYMKEGFDNYVPKPINRNHLFSVLSNYLD